MVTPQALLPTRKISEHYIGQVSPSDIMTPSDIADEYINLYY